MSLTKEQIRAICEAAAILDAKEVPKGNRILRYMDDDGRSIEAKTDASGKVISRKVLG